MSSRLIVLVLIVAIAAGGGLAIQGGIENRALRAEYERLRQLVGEMTVEDPAKIKVTAVPTEDPLEFVWRVHLPENQTYRWRTETSGGDSGEGTSLQNVAQQYLIRFRFRNNEGVLHKFLARPGGSSYSTFGGQITASLLTDPDEQLRAQQLATDGPQVIELNEVATLLKLEFTNSFRNEISEKLANESEYERRFLENPLVIVSFGTNEAFETKQGQRGAAP